MTLKARGTPGHGSLGRDDNATVRLAEAVGRPRPRAPAAAPLAGDARYLEVLASSQPFPRSLLLAG